MKEGDFFVYNDQFKSYRVYILGYHQIEISIHVTSTEDATFSKSKNIYANKDHEKEHQAPKFAETSRLPV